MQTHIFMLGSKHATTQMVTLYLSRLPDILFPEWNTIFCGCLLYKHPWKASLGKNTINDLLITNRNSGCHGELSPNTDCTLEDVQRLPLLHVNWNFSLFLSPSSAVGMHFIWCNLFSFHPQWFLENVWWFTFRWYQVSYENLETL